NKAVVGMNEDESDRDESRDDGVDGDVTSNTFFDSQSFDSRSCGGLSLRRKLSKINATFSFNNVEKEPNLSNVNNASGSMDEVMNEVPIRKKHVSFVNVVQGLSKSGNNKLKLIRVCMND
nr:hypothetical protein [Tanacetum cinerariifolium]